MVLHRQGQRHKVTVSRRVLWKTVCSGRRMPRASSAWSLGTAGPTAVEGRREDALEPDEAMTASGASPSRKSDHNLLPLIFHVVVVQRPLYGPPRDLYRGRCFRFPHFRRRFDAGRCAAARQKKSLCFSEQRLFLWKTVWSDEEPDRGQPPLPTSSRMGRAKFISFPGPYPSTAQHAAAAHKHIVQIPQHWDKSGTDQWESACASMPAYRFQPRRVPSFQCHKHRRDLRSSLLRSFGSIAYFLFALVLRQVASIELVIPALLGDQLIMAARSMIRPCSSATMQPALRTWTGGER